MSLKQELVKNQHHINLICEVLVLVKISINY